MYKNTILILILIHVLTSCKHQEIKTSKSNQPISKNTEIINIRKVVEKIQNGDEFIFLHTYETCGLTDNAVQKALSYQENAPLFYYIGKGLTDDLDSLPREVINQYFQPFAKYSPVLYYYKNGYLIDISLKSAHSFGLANFQQRNHSGSNFITIKELNSNRKKTILMNAELSYLNLAGVNLINTTLRNKNFEGSDLRNANFTKTKLIDVNFSHANLTGAEFKEIQESTHVFWGTCICPDGTESKNHNYSCENHLNPKRDPTITTDSPSEISKDELFYDIDDNNETTMF